MVALIATLQTMQHGMQQTMQQDRQHMQQAIQQTMQNAMSALQMNVQTQLTDQQRSAQAWLQSMEERVTQEQRTVFAKVGAKATSVGTGLEELANNAHESYLVVQDLKKKMEEQEQAARGHHHEHRHLHHGPHQGRKISHGSQSPSCSRPTSKIPADGTGTCSPQRWPTQQCRTSQARGIPTASSALCGDGAGGTQARCDADRIQPVGILRVCHTKLKQKREITGDTATKLEGREQAHAEQAARLLRNIYLHLPWAQVVPRVALLSQATRVAHRGSSAFAPALASPAHLPSSLLPARLLLRHVRFPPPRSPAPLPWLSLSLVRSPPRLRWDACGLLCFFHLSGLREVC
jgi:hypothetical protein